MFASHELGAERRIMNSFVTIRGGSDKEEARWVGKVLLQITCVVTGEEGDSMVLVQLTECVSSLHAVSDALGCLCVRCAAADD